MPLWFKTPLTTNQKLIKIEPFQGEWLQVWLCESCNTTVKIINQKPKLTRAKMECQHCDKVKRAADS